ncbi:F-box/LRR-repeat protein 4-like [Camellia sinensis]|uniref:F-box/LRR-repeat protein 4-like n=1 Tax=Camellia sinensis TaxID=4442 RepID=UPI001036747E|nr:F-box/LRR-repeat protein 4-like [Camellia sinensis]
MNNLKILRCCYLKVFRNHHLVAIADALPWLEKLSIQHSSIPSYYQRGFNSKSAKYIVTNVGIEVISRKLPRLRKIDITGQLGCSDRSLIALLSNCELLNVIRGRYYSLPDDLFTFENSMNFAQSLRDLRIDAYEDHDRLLGSISTAGISLEKILIYDDSGLSFHGLSNFLSACPSLKHLQLVSINFLNDNSVRELCRYQTNLVSIKLDFCLDITATTFFILAKECPLLSEIELQEIKLPVGDDFDMELESNYQIISLELSHVGHLNDEFLRKIGFVCPNLQTLNVTGLNRLTKEGIGDILKCCSQIKHLIVDKTRELGIFLEQFKTRHIKIEHHFIRSGLELELWEETYKKRRNPVLSKKPISNPTLKCPVVERENQESKKAKAVKVKVNVNADGVEDTLSKTTIATTCTTSASKKVFFQRLWSVDDEIAIL